MTRTRLTTIGVALATVAVLALGWVLGIAPVLARASDADASTQEARQQTALASTTLAALKARYAHLDERRADLAAASAAMPESPDLEDFVDEVQSAAAANGLALASLTFSDATLYGGGGGSGATTAGAASGAADATGSSPSPAPAASGGTAQSGQLVTIPVSISVSGGADAGIAFVDAVQTGARTFLVTTVSQTPGDTATVAITGYVFLRMPAPAAAGPSAGGTPTPAATPTPGAADQGQSQAAGR